MRNTNCRNLSYDCRTLSHWICSMLFIGRLYFRGGIICPKSAEYTLNSWIAIRLENLL